MNSSDYGCQGFLCTGHSRSYNGANRLSFLLDNSPETRASSPGYLHTGNSTKVSFYSDGSVGFTDPGKPEQIIPAGADTGAVNGDN
jgi:hypothetical protein